MIDLTASKWNPKNLSILEPLSALENNLPTKQHNLKAVKPLQTKITVISECGPKQHQQDLEPRGLLKSEEVGYDCQFRWCYGIVLKC